MKYALVTREEFDRAEKPYPHPHYPEIMVGTGPIMEPVRRAVRMRYIQQVLDGVTIHELR